MNANTHYITAISSALAAIASGSLAYWFIHLSTRHVSLAAETWQFEERRRVKLRQGSIVYRLFEPLLEELLPILGHTRTAAAREQLAHKLAVACPEVPWKPEEFLAARRFEAALAALGGFTFGWLLGSPWYGLAIAPLAAYGYQMFALKQVTERAERWKNQFRKRLPYAIDLIALMIESGGGFVDGLKTIARESQDHPLGIEFAKVERELELGRSRREALAALESRVADESLSEIVLAINKGEELGTPLAQILRSQAEQLLLKRSQWAEKAAADAQVKIVFPGMLIMIACLLVVVSPFLLAATLGAAR